MKREGILLAIRPQVADLAESLLRDTGMPLVRTHTLADAGLQLQQGCFRLIVGTLQFDDSRLFDLLPLARAAGTPLLAVRMTPGLLPESVIEALFKAVQLCGFHGWMDVCRVTERHGEAEAVRRLQSLVLDTALPSIPD